MTHEITFNEQAGRFELRLDGVLASIADYRVLGDRVMMPHTVTSLGYRGQGLAAEVVRAALDDARTRGLQVVPMCSFVAEFIDENPEYQDLTAPANASISPGMSEPAGE
jgi:predicted GNAT family acetyltransferase